MTRESRGAFLKECLIAAAAFAACTAWVFRDLLLSGGVDALQQYPPSNPRFLWHMSEMTYITQAAIGVQNRLLHEGVFPAWTPFAAGGTPLIAKMQNGFFALHHVLLYALPLEWAPRIYTAVILLKNFLAFFSTFLLARCLGLGLWSAIFSGVWFIASALCLGGIFTWPGAALAVPMTLLLIELLFRRQAALSVILLPWAVAIPFLSGHFETGVYNFGAASFYFLFRWRRGPEGAAASWKPLWLFMAAAAAGILLACAQALAGVEYVNRSYSKIWHDRRFFGFWDWDTVNKHLGGEDAPLLLLGWSAAAGFIWSLRRLLRAPSAEPTWRWAGLAVSCLALAVGSLSILGLQESLSNFVFREATYSSPWLPVTGFIGLTLALWAWSLERGCGGGLRALGWLLLAEIPLLLREPGLANAVIHLPLFNNFHNATSHYRWEFHLSRAILCALAFQKCLEPPAQQPLASRLAQARRLALLLSIMTAGYLAGLGLKAPLCRLMPSAAAWRPGYDGAAGHFSTPERIQTLQANLPLSGWATTHKPVSSIEVGVWQGNALTAAQSAEVLEPDAPGPRRRFFLTLRRSPQMPANGMLAAKVHYADGSSALIPGPDYSFLLDQGSRTGWMLLAAVLAAPLVLLLPAWPLKLAFLFLCLAPLHSLKANAIAADQIPFRLPALEKIREDRSGPFRITSLEYNFLQADYPGLYGLGDVRTGGDSIDVLTAIYFYHLAASFAEGRNPQSLQTALKLLGLAGVKYLVHPPDSPPLQHPALEKFYDGPDMSVWRNSLAMPRALFFDQAVYLPLGNIRDWPNRDRFMAPLAGGLEKGSLDPAKTLVLHDAPKENFPAAVSSGTSRASIESYGANRVKVSVEAAKPGFLFLSDTFFPGWKALRDGRPAQILRAWLNFRAVPVPQGRSVVEFIYRPLPLTAGLLTAGLTALAWLFFYRAYRLRRLDWLEAAPPAPTEGKKKKGKNAVPALPIPEDPLARRCAGALEAVLAALIGSNLAYWLFWTAFICRQTLANAAARALLAVLFLVLLADFFATIKRPQSGIKEPT